MSECWINVYADWPHTPLSHLYQWEHRDDAARPSKAHVHLIGKKARTLYRIHIRSKR